MKVFLGPIIFGLLLGLIIGASIRKTTSFKFTVGTYVVILLVVIFTSFQLGQFDFYFDFPVTTGFLSGGVGLLLGRLIFGRGD